LIDGNSTHDSNLFVKVHLAVKGVESKHKRCEHCLLQRWMNHRKLTKTHALKYNSSWRLCEWNGDLGKIPMQKYGRSWQYGL